MKQDASENKLFNPLEMNPLFKSMLIIGFINLLFIGCTQPIPVPQTSLYKRLGGEKTLVAFSLQVSRKPKIQEAIGSDQGRIFRKRLSEWMCRASSGPCDFPSRKEFFQEVELNPGQQRLLMQALMEVLSETGVPEPIRQELLSELAKS
jgi:hypothetical protein|tara:strand:- start:9835 stop:10281 length:447 start_codon:yes stop_codon:yes gene_type:complete